MENNYKGIKFRVSDHARIPENKDYYAKDYAPIWSEGVLVIKNLENTVPWTYVIKEIY